MKREERDNAISKGRKHLDKIATVLDDAFQDQSVTHIRTKKVEERRKLAADAASQNASVDLLTALEKMPTQGYQTKTLKYQTSTQNI